MKSSIRALTLTSILLVSAPAFASGPDNVYGQPGRLESIVCHGAYVTSKSDAEDRVETAIEASCTGLGTRPAYEECRAGIIRRMLSPAPTAIFTGIAVSGQKTLQMNIVDGGKTTFSSLRGATMYPGLAPARGFLRFFREGVQGQDDYGADTSDLSVDGQAVNQISVPVHRRFASDSYYFFVDGCQLAWSNR